jgi:hypothetical protein
MVAARCGRNPASPMSDMTVSNMFYCRSNNWWTVAFRFLLALVLLLGTSVHATADESVIASVSAGECTLSLEAAENWPTLRLRVGHPNYRPCFIDKAAVVETLTQAFAEPHPILASRDFTSLALGRLIDYPWLVRLLALRAAQDPQWDAAAGKPRGVQVNRYVADVLFSSEIVSEIEMPLRVQGYRITGVSVEKVLVGGFENVPQLEMPRRKGKIPFDAQVWFRLEHD